MDALTDGQLIEHYRGTGDVRYFDTLIRRHIRTVRATVFPMVLNNADADEITQEVFLRAMRGIPRFRGTARFSSWLYRIAVNTTRSFQRKSNRVPVLDPTNMPEEEALCDDPAGELLSREADAEIGKALAQLSAPLRAAITLTAIQGMSVKDAAHAEGCLVATLYWRVHEARRILKGKLARYMSS